MSSAATIAIISASQSSYRGGHYSSFGHGPWPSGLVGIALGMFLVVVILSLFALLAGSVHIVSVEARRRDWMSVAVGSFLGFVSLAGILLSIGVLFNV